MTNQNETACPTADDETLTEIEREGNRRAFRLGGVEDEITGLLDELDYDRLSPVLETVILAALKHGRDLLKAAKLELEAVPA